MRTIKWLDDHFEESFLVVFLAVISVVELAQVLIRKIPFIPALTWAEEFCRFMWIWSVFISLPYTIRKGNMLRVTVLLDILPSGARKVFNLVVDLIVLASMGFCAWHSVSVVSGIVASGETSPAMLWPMWIVYSFMLIGFALGFARGIQMFILHCQHFSDSGKSTLERTIEEAAEEVQSGKPAEEGRE